MVVVFPGFADLDETKFFPVVIPMRYDIPVIHQIDISLHSLFPLFHREPVFQIPQETLKTRKSRILDRIVVVMLVFDI